MEQRLQGQATDSDENQAQDITAASADMTDNDSYRIRSVLIRTISGNLIPQIKRVSFNDQAVVLNKNEGLEQQQQKEPWEDTGFQNIIAPRESTAHPELLIQCATQSRSSNNTSGDSMLDGITVTTQRCLDAFFLWNQVTLKPAASSAMATPVFSSLMAPVALLTVSATTVTAKAATSIDTASSMLMALPTATTSTHTSYQHSTNSNASGGRDNYTLMERSTSEPSKSTTFLQRYQQTQQQQQLRQRQPHTIEEEELEPIRPQTHERRESIKKLGLFQAPTAAISPQMTVTQHDDNDNNTDSSSHVVKAISDSTSQSHALGTNLSLGTRTRRSFSLVHPRSVQVNETTNLSSAFSHSKTQEYTALRRKSFDYNSFKTTPRLASEAPASAFTTEPQVSGRREEGAAVEHRNFMYRVAHPQRYKREIEQLHSELPQHSSK
ncbi:hypothetical protein BGX27_003073 [Mortierella sp. AM989]|nr:hypothetical protein BGX27_003073 [Mortierella sp. AM989]